MKSKQALKEFEKYLAARGTGGIPSTPESAFTAMLAFYKEVRATDVDMDADGDMLLFQWGTYDWGKGARFEVNLTRQFIRPGGGDEGIWQLGVTYRYLPGEPLSNLASGGRWCATPSDLAEFERFVLGHPTLEAVRSRRDCEAELMYECAG